MEPERDAGGARARGRGARARGSDAGSPVRVSGSWTWAAGFSVWASEVCWASSNGLAPISWASFIFFYFCFNQIN